jgi:hypothetical protein
MDSLKYHPGPPCPTLLRPTGEPSLKWPYGRFRGRQGRQGQGRQPGAVFYPFRHPTPYVYDRVVTFVLRTRSRENMFNIHVHEVCADFKDRREEDGQPDSLTISIFLVI